MQAANEQRCKELARRHASAGERAARIWSKAQPALADHPYLAGKGVATHGLRLYQGTLVAPVRDMEGDLHGLQFIGASGTKRFLKDSAVRSHYFRIAKAGGLRFEIPFPTQDAHFQELPGVRYFAKHAAG